jgi:Trypsin-co-occurring domain 1
LGTRLIKLEDGTLVEVETAGTEVQEIAGSLAEQVDTTLNKIKPVLLKACLPVAQAVKEMRDQVELDQVEIELGLSFESEGNLYITKAKLGANVLVRMTLKGS